jgi:hypothetical protein
MSRDRPQVTERILRDPEAVAPELVRDPWSPIWPPGASIRPRSIAPNAFL